MQNHTTKRVLDTITRMTAAFHERDLDGVMATYEDGATVVFEPGAPISEPAGVRDAFRAMFQIEPRFAFGAHQVFVANDLALHLAPWTMTGRAPDGTEVADSGLSVAVLHRGPDGGWLLVIDNPHGQAR